MLLSPQSIQKIIRAFLSIFNVFIELTLHASRLDMHPTWVCLFNVYATFGLGSKAAPNMVNKQYTFVS